MKYLITLICSVFLFTISSCRKDWGCTCTNNKTQEQDTYILTKKSKAVAEDLCESYEYEYSDGTCSLDN
ncbi:hypothetical protein [Parvicella tangerina]|uniref:Uncharacterized protein n=1 Tax=Parvicella tangerina TaxID=2829795 RepID=A0A916JPX3_9FLAO|nr:hypothetical protein [Parvicella tangerina]CAG5086090.1 hypothetical protein CRYO30217_03004 [Parvicella tangerina]